MLTAALVAHAESRGLNIQAQNLPRAIEVRPDVRDAVCDALLVYRLTHVYGASKREITDAYGPLSGVSKPCAIIRSKWDAMS